MIKCYTLDGKFEEAEYKDFTAISQVLNKNRKAISGMDINIIIELLNLLGKEIVSNTLINKLEGVNYISLWLRKDNLKRICDVNYANIDYFNEFCSISENVSIMMQPRGIVCHWVAENIPTLAFFSLVPAILSKNASILKVPEKNITILLILLKVLNGVEITKEGKTYSGKDIVRSISVVSFSGKDEELSAQFSMAADCKVIWGGTDAVRAVTALPQQEHCDIVTLGPKYSFAVFEKGFIESEDFDQAIKKIVLDAAIFNQMACSSPHTIFFEKSKYSIEEIALTMKSHFEKLPRRFLEQNTPEGTISKIINTRGIYLLEDNKQILKSEGTEWTILINKEVSLEEPVKGKCIFIKEVDSIKEVLPLITRKVQAIAIGIKDKLLEKEFAKEATYNGADRIIAPGKMHDFDIPWDGLMILNRLVRWVVLKR